MLRSSVIGKIIANATDVYKPNVEYKIRVFEYLNRSILHEINMMKLSYARKYHKKYRISKIQIV